MDKTKVTISIIMPVYNAEKFIAESLKSGLNQTVRDIEIICIDDCSTDGSVSIIRQFVESDERISLITLDKNIGPPAARNIGISKASGEFILPLDADDVIDETYCEKALKAFSENHDVSVVYCEADRFDENRTWEWNLQKYSRKKILYQNMVFCAAFYKKKDWEAFGGYRDNMKEGYEDWDFWLNFVERGMDFHRIPEVLFHYRQVEESRDFFAKRRESKEKLFKQITGNHPSLYRFPKARMLFVDFFVRYLLPCRRVFRILNFYKRKMQ